MNGPMKHGATKEESFIMVCKSMVILQRYVSILVILKYNGEPNSFMHMVCDESW